MIDRENVIRRKEGRKVDMKGERERERYHQNHTMIFLPELDDFYTEAFEIT